MNVFKRKWKNIYSFKRENVKQFQIFVKLQNPLSNIKCRKYFTFNFHVHFERSTTFNILQQSRN